jgi:hypothetical protein
VQIIDSSTTDARIFLYLLMPLVLLKLLEKIRLHLMQEPPWNWCYKEATVTVV